PGGGAKRRPRVPPSHESSQEGIRARRTLAASAVALYPGADHADGADRRLQPPSFGGAAAGALAALEPGPPALERAAHDAGTDREHAGRAPRGRNGGGRQAANVRSDSVQPRTHRGARQAGPGRARLRVLRGGQTRNRSLASREDRDLIADCAIAGVATISGPRARLCADVHTPALIRAMLPLRPFPGP